MKIFIECMHKFEIIIQQIFAYFNRDPSGRGACRLPQKNGQFRLLASCIILTKTYRFLTATLEQEWGI